VDSCSVKPSPFYAVSHVADAIERTVCSLTDRPEAFPVCGPLVCPIHEVLLGYPWALLPNRTGSVKGLRGFVPVSIVQWPPPGTPLWRSTITNATMTALDASGRKLECWWQVRVPALKELGSAIINVRNGTYNETIRFKGYGRGHVYKLKGRARDSLRGRGSSVGAGIRDPSDKQTGRSLTISESEDRGSVLVPKVKVQFSESNVSDIKLDVYVSRNDQPNVLTFLAYGQTNDVLISL
jgi:hypothetical protein